MLLDDIIQAASTRGLARVDASRGSIHRPHLLDDWTTAHLDHYALWLVNATVRGALLHLLATHVNPWRQRLSARIAKIKVGDDQPAPRESNVG